MEYRFIEPLDVLILRGNKLFGDPGSYGECLMPPWPSVVAGAIRSRMLVDDNVDLAAFGRDEIQHPTLGSPTNPGAFTLNGFYLARQKIDGAMEILFPLPGDLVVSKTDDDLQIRQLVPQVIDLPSSFSLAQLPVLAQGNTRSKPENGYWLKQTGWTSYLHGKVPAPDQLVHSSLLWTFDARVGIGIGMNEDTRSVEDGKLFSTQAIAMHAGVGFVTAVSGATPSEDGLMRFGGDGRAASIARVDIDLPTPDYEPIASTRRCRIVLTSPGLFPGGWKLPGTDADNRVTLPGGISAKLVSAAVNRAETISGWDLAKWEPKPAQRVAPTGSVYWLEELVTSSGSTIEEALGKLVETGLWGEPCEDAGRRAEGFNRCAIGAWL